MLRGAWGRRGSHPRASALQGRTATGLASRAKDCRRSGFRFPAGSEIDPATETRFGQPNPPAGPAARWPESDGGRPGPPGQLLSGEARFARKVFTRQEPNRPYRVPGPRNRRIERRLWADRPKGPSPVVSAGRPPAFPSRRGHDRSHGQPGAPGVPARSGSGVRGPEVLLQGVARLSLGCSGGAFGSSFRAAIAPFLVLLAGPSGPADSKEAPVRSRSRRPGMGAAGERNKGAGGKGAQQASPPCRMASRPANCRFSGTERAKRKFAPVWLGLLLRRGQRRRGLLGGTPPAASFSLTGEEKKRSLSALRKQLPGSTELPVLRERSRLGNSGVPRVGKMDRGARRCFFPAQQREEAKRRRQTKKGVPANCRKWGLQRSPEVRAPRAESSRQPGLSPRQSSA